MTRENAPSHKGLDPEEEGVGNIASFYHPKNIKIGLGRIIWTPETYFTAAGWVLPGGRKTADEAEARHAAEYIDRVLRAA